MNHSDLHNSSLNNANEGVSDPKLIANEFNGFFWPTLDRILPRNLQFCNDEFYKFLKGSENDSMFLYNTTCDEGGQELQAKWFASPVAVLTKLIAK